jgi:signal transduction histidine kinase
MNENIQQPMLIGTPSDDLGFTFNENEFLHPLFDDKWQCQSIRYLHQGKQHWFFSALDISKLLNKNQSVTQQNLIRVLGHELRNSLTPMTSMADTLLCSDKLEEVQTRKVLSRIQQRSNRLLAFIDQYSQLSQLPPPKLSWFDFTEIYTEAKSMVNGHCEFTFQGNTQCYGDANQIAQVLINVFKNAKEACLEDDCKISVKVFYLKKEQIIEITDNGPGFANLDNVLTPFYTTKPHGSGIGLSLCAGITRNHLGHFNVVNVPDGGAKITLAWPIMERK